MTVKADEALCAGFETQARRAPEAPALVGAGTPLAYGELAVRVRELDAALAGAGLAPGHLAGVLVPSGVAAVVALLALGRRGTAFAWLDPGDPAQRVHRLADEARASALLATPDALAEHGDLGRPVVALDDDGRVAAAAPAGEAPAVAELDGAGCLVFTSGSTGRPKGIVQTGGNLARFAAAFAERFGVGPGARLVQWASPTYDAAYVESLAALGSGATLVLAEPRIRWAPERLLEHVAAHGATHLQTVPSYLAELLDRVPAERADALWGDAARSLTTVLLAGEPLRPRLVDALRARLPDVRVANLYGPTEAILATAYELPPGPVDGDRVPIGAALPGRELLLWETAAPPAPGDEGELAIAGELALGYWRQPELTARAFATLAGRRVYRTGDRVRARPSGELEFLGRVDDEVKITGTRVVPREVEAELERHPAVRAAAVVVDRREEAPRLVAFAALHDAAGADGATLREHLAARLPAPMVPARCLALDALPLLRTGKVDRAALLERAAADEERAGGAGDGPLAADERALAALWEEVLDAPPADGDADFFALGGNSLRATQLAVRLEELRGAEVPLELAFEAPTLREMAAWLRELSPPPSR